MRRSSRLSLVVGCLSTAFALSAEAGVIDTPIPLVGGAKVKHVFTVTGVSGNYQGALETVFSCTSLEKQQITIAIEVFNFNGVLMNDVTAGQPGQEKGVAVVDPGATAVFETTPNVEAFSADDGIILSANVNHGSARILSTGKKIVCAALLASKTGSPPASMVALPVFKKAQKGD